MLFDSTVRAEVSRTFGATLVVLLTIVLTMMLLRTLRLAAAGSVSPQDVALVLGYFALGQLPTLLALSLYVATVIALSRMYRASEMVVWFTSGVSLGRVLRPLLQVGAPVVALVGLLAMVAWPWANQRIADLRTRYEQRTDLMRVSPGAFQSSSDGKRVFFIERQSDADGGVGRHVFLIDRSGARESVTTAVSGEVRSVAGLRTLTLNHGHRSEVDSSTGEASRVSFERFTLNVDPSPSSRAATAPPKATALPELLRQRTPAAMGELAWRLGLALATFNLLLLAVGTSASNPRRANSWGLLFALLAFVTYFNLINLSQAWVAAGRMSLTSALLAVHGSVLALALALVAWRQGGWLRRRAGPASAPNRTQARTPQHAADKVVP